LGSSFGLLRNSCKHIDSIVWLRGRGHPARGCCLAVHGHGCAMGRSQQLSIARWARRGTGAFCEAVLSHKTAVVWSSCACCWPRRAKPGRCCGSHCMANVASASLRDSPIRLDTTAYLLSHRVDALSLTCCPPRASLLHRSVS
jgi:hypothetical protein